MGIRISQIGRRICSVPSINLCSRQRLVCWVSGLIGLLICVMLAGWMEAGQRAYHNRINQVQRQRIQGIHQKLARLMRTTSTRRLMPQVAAPIHFIKNIYRAAMRRYVLVQQIRVLRALGQQRPNGVWIESVRGDRQQVTLNVITENPRALNSWLKQALERWPSVLFEIERVDAIPTSVSRHSQSSVAQGIETQEIGQKKTIVRRQDVVRWRAVIVLITTLSMSNDDAGLYEGKKYEGNKLRERRKRYDKS